MPMSDKKKITLNLAAAVIVLLLNACVQFFLSPYIVKAIGVEAQGYVQLAVNFTTYFSLVTIALTSMSGRFLTISVARGNTEEAASYYTSIFFGNCVLFVTMFIPISVFVANAEKIIEIPVSMQTDVKLLFSLVFGAFLINTLFSVWGNTFFIINRLYLNSISLMVTAIFNAIVILILFSTFKAHMWYSAAAGLAIMPFTIWWAIFYKKKYLPELKIQRKLFSIKRLVEVISGGIWNAVQQAGSILSTGLDLLICNLMLDPTMMGVLAVSKTIPTMLQALANQIAYNFSPQLTMKYAKGDIKGLIRDVRRFDKFVAVFCSIPLGGFIAFGEPFFRLWMPTQDAHLLQILSVLTCLNLVVVNGVLPLGALFTVYNKVKPQAVAWVIQGFLNIVFVYLALKTTNLGVFAVAGLSSIINITRQFVYSVPLVSKYLNLKWYSLLPDLAISALSSGLVAAIGYGISTIVPLTGWKMLLLACGATVLIGAVANFVIVLNKSERRFVIELIMKLKGKVISK